VQNLREFTDALGVRPTRHTRHRAEQCANLFGLSGSMVESMQGRRKIEVVQDALIQLLNYTMKCFG
jgi:hypothetical protein